MLFIGNEKGGQCQDPDPAPAHTTDCSGDIGTHSRVSVCSSPWGTGVARHNLLVEACIWRRVCAGHSRFCGGPAPEKALPQRLLNVKGLGSARVSSWRADSVLQHPCGRRPHDQAATVLPCSELRAHHLHAASAVCGGLGTPPRPPPLPRPHPVRSPALLDECRHADALCASA